MFSSALKRCVSLLCMVAPLCFWGSAAAQKPVQAVLKGAFNERMTPDVVVSGAVVVGVSSSVPFNGASLSSLAILPTAGVETVCLTVESHDGVYTSRNEYEMPGGLEPGFPVQLPYDRSRFLEELSAYVDDALALKAIPSSCAEPVDAGTVLPLQRLDQLAMDTLRFYINSIGATDIYISTVSTEGSCRPVQGRQTSFDHVCQIGIPPASSGANSSETVVHIDRERYGRELPAAEVRVLQGVSAR